MIVLVTGANGFVGRHLVRELLQSGHTPIATSHQGRVEECDETHSLTLPDRATAAQIVAATQPDALFHLAAVAEVPAADSDPCGAMRTNVDGTVDLLEAVRTKSPKTRVFFVSSSNVYGIVPEGEQPIAEGRAYAPVGVYARSKVAAECWVQAYAAVLERAPVILRPFNHVGVGQTASYALPAFARQIAELEASDEEPVVRVGNLEVRRDILDVRDVVRAYVSLLACESPPAILNVCRGRTYLLSELLEELCAASSREIRVEVDPARVRKNDLTLLQGDSSLLQESCDWAPTIEMSETLQSLLFDWRQRIGQPPAVSKASGGAAEEAP